jgi:hypothetical protein
MLPCNNITRCHDLIIFEENVTALRAFCKTCRRSYVVRKDGNGNPEKRKYARLFKKDILQRHENLYYKYHPEVMNIL